MAVVDLMINPSCVESNSHHLEDISTAITKLASASEAQFQEIKEEKWFTRLFDMVTFSQKKDIRIAEQIGTLAQAQQILVEILIALSSDNQEISDLVRENIDATAKLQKNDLYLLDRIKSLENIAFGFQKASKLSTLSNHDKNTLSACLHYLADEFELTSNEQRAYATAVLALLQNDDAWVLDGLERAVGSVKDKEAVLTCCLEYIYLHHQSTSDFETDLCTKLIYNMFDMGEQTASRIKNNVTKAVNLRGADGLIRKYSECEKAAVKDTFAVNLDIDISDFSEKNYSTAPAIMQHSFSDVETCVLRYVTESEKPFGTPQTHTLKQQTWQKVSDDKKEKLVKSLFGENTPALKTVVAITKSKKSYLVFTTFALYYICGKEFLQIRYGEISPGTLGTTVEGDEPVFFCGTKKIPGSEVNIDALKNFCSEVSQITFKPDTDQLQPLSDLPFEVQIDYYSILSGVVGRTEGLHEVYRLVCDRKLEEYWNLFSEEQDTPIVQRIKDWKHTIPYPNEESTCAALLSDICRVLYITKNYGGHIGSGKEISTNNIVKEEETLFSYIVGDEAELGQIKNTAKMQVDAFINTISKYDPHSPERFKELSSTLRSYDRAATASKAAGLQSINQQLVVVDKKLRDKANVSILSVAYEQQVEHLIRKFLKEAKSLGKYTERFLTADREKMLKQMAPKGKVIQAEDTIGLYDPSIVNTIISTYSGILFAKDGFYYKDRLRVTWVPYAEIEAVKKGIGSLKITTRKEGAKRQTSIDLNGILFATSELEKLFSDIRVLYQG